jgi:hypothetical protein
LNYDINEIVLNDQIIRRIVIGILVKLNKNWKQKKREKSPHNRGSWDYTVVNPEAVNDKRWIEEEDMRNLLGYWAEAWEVCENGRIWCWESLNM